MTSKLPDHTFNKGEWYLDPEDGQWIKSLEEWSRPPSPLFLTVSEAAKLGLTPPREKVEGWFIKVSANPLSAFEGPYKKPTDDERCENVYLKECDPPEGE